MPDERISFRPSLDPHGFFPMRVDETCLHEADRRAALVEEVYSPQDWRGCLTSKELQALVKGLADAEQNESTYLIRSPAYESPQKRERLFEAARLGTFRAYARRRYAAGRSIWYGDGPPPWQR
jgi:hypothetical protein